MAPSFDTPPREDTPNDSESPLWEIKAIPGKGQGVLATRFITPGTLLFHEKPLLTTETLTDPSTTEKQLARLLRALPKESQRAYLSLHNNYPGQGSPSQTSSAPTHIHSDPPPPSAASSKTSPASTIPVSPPPNTPGTKNVKNSSYTPAQSRTRGIFKFVCTCALCSLPPSELKKSDARLIRAASLDQAVGDAETVMKAPEKVLKTCKSLETIYREEGIQDQRVGRLYWDAFQICNRHGDLARASAFARKYRERKVLGEGEDSTGAEEALIFILDPKKDDSYGGTQRWRSRVQDIPKDLSEAEFEKWLWRQ